jgi:hypothetical protein
LKNEDIHTDRQLQGLFQSFEPPVPNGAWDGIVDRMNRKRRHRVVFWWIAAAAIFVGGIIGLWFVLSDTQTVLKSAKHKEIIVNTPSDKQTEPSKTAETVNTGNIHSKDVVQSLSQKEKEAHVDGMTILPNNPERNDLDLTRPESAPVELSGNTALPEPFKLRYRASQWMAVNDFRSLEIAWRGAMKSVDSLKSSPSKWTLSAALQQMQSGNGYSVNPTFSRYVHKNYLSRMQEGELNMGSMGFAIHLGYQIHKKYAISGGVQFRQLNTRQQFDFADEVPVTLMPGNTPDKFGNYPIIGYFGNSGRVSYSGFQRNTMLEIPVGINAEYRVAPKWAVRPSIYINTGFIGGINGFTLDYQQLQLMKQQTEWFRKVQMSGSFSVGAFRQMGRKLQWGATINGTRMLTPAYIPDASVRPRNHSLGIGTQLIWRID